MTELYLDRAPSPIGTIALVSRENGALCALDFADREDTLRARLARRFGPVAPRVRKDAGGHTSRLRAYLAGELDALDESQVDPGGTDFQQRVFAALRRVPSGSTRTYTEIAHAIGKPGAARAVGTANARNPIALVIPCHRILPADQTLGGYAGGPTRKAWLLTHERAQHTKRRPRPSPTRRATNPTRAKTPQARQSRNPLPAPHAKQNESNGRRERDESA